MRKLWNRPNLPIWSVSTLSAEGHGNMNIASYVSAISLDPKLMVLSIYKGTKTLENLVHKKHCVLQLLSEPLAPVVRICGKESGHTIDKIARLQKRYTLDWYQDFPYFAAACGFMELRATHFNDVGGDHVLVTGAVEKYKNLNDAPILTMSHLREKGLVR